MIIRKLLSVFAHSLKARIYPTCEMLAHGFFYFLLLLACIKVQIGKTRGIEDSAYVLVFCSI